MLGFIPPPIAKDTEIIDKKNNDQKSKKELKNPNPINPVIILISVICLFFITFLLISN
tara:strand:- start:268 stop:441 length:174 start_codon:yes stop_codon:yes gene_type:complete